MSQKQNPSVNGKKVFMSKNRLELLEALADFDDDRAVHLVGRHDALADLAVGALGCFGVLGHVVHFPASAAAISR